MNDRQTRRHAYLNIITAAKEPPKHPTPKKKIAVVKYTPHSGSQSIVINMFFYLYWWRSWKEAVSILQEGGANTSGNFMSLDYSRLSKSPPPTKKTPRVILYS
uniref:Uncharacterized protein n=1 Tax=Opuntia streptacantha TaxID=393608 RepID=A0A7C9F2L8_OPUST